MTASPSRMLSLLSLLQTRRDWPGQALADRLGVTPRTVRRDVTRLRDLGYRISATKGPDGGYRLAAGSQMPPLLLDDEQAVAVAVALRAAATTGVDLEEAAARALATVQQVMPARLRHRVEGIRFDGVGPDVRVAPAVLEVVSVAVREQRVLRMRYRGVQETRHVEPHAVVVRASRWYLVAWDLDVADWRIFRLDHLEPRSPAGARFAPRAIPTGDASTFVQARAKGAQTEDVWPCSGQVLVDLPLAAVARWAGDGQVEAVSPTRTLLTVGSWSWTGLLAHVLKFDAPFAVVGPEPLRLAAAELSGRLASATSPV